MQATMLPLAMAMVLAGTCQAQSRADHPGNANAQSLASPPAGAADTDRDAAPRSAFGKVMAVMISALQQQSGRQARQSPQPPVRTSATGTPLGIEVGMSFRDRGHASPAPAVLPAGPTVDEAPPAAAPEAIRGLARTGPAG
jgi:hypothetical protein